MDAQTLRTVDDVIRELGGDPAVAVLTARTRQAVNNWRLRKRFPAATYLIFSDALTERNYTAPPILWGIPSAAPGANARLVRNGKQIGRRRKRNGARR